MTPLNTPDRLRDIVYRSLKGEAPEQCPYYIWVDDRMVPPLAERYGPAPWIARLPRRNVKLHGASPWHPGRRRSLQ